MAFLDDFSRRFSEASQRVMQKTGELSNATKANSQIAEEERKLNQYYLQIGKLYVSRRRGNPEPEFVELVQLAVQSEATILARQRQLQAMASGNVCQRCGTPIWSDSMFCTNCGAPVEKHAAPAARASYCSNCGSVLNEGMLFCTNCGCPAPKHEPQQQYAAPTGYQPPAQFSPPQPVPQPPLSGFSENAGYQPSYASAPQQEEALSENEPLNAAPEQEAVENTPVVERPPEMADAPVPDFSSAETLQPPAMFDLGESIETEINEAEPSAAFAPFDVGTSMHDFEPNHFNTPDESAFAPADDDNTTTDAIPASAPEGFTSFVEEVPEAPAEAALPLEEPVQEMFPARFCPSCGTPIEPGDAFCMNCGTRI